MTSTIVCGVDGSRPSRAAAQLASVLADASGQGVQYVYAARSAESTSAMDDARRVRERLVDALGREVPLRVMPGTPAEQLLLATRGASMLVLGTRGRGRRLRAFAGGFTTAVARAAAVPVVVVPERGDRTGTSARTLVSGVRDDRDLACAASCSRLARELGLLLTLVHVVVPPRMPVAPGGGAPPPTLPPRADGLAADAAALLDEIACTIAAQAPTVCRRRVVHGPVGMELSRVAKAEDALLVALGPSRHQALRPPLGRRCARQLLRRGHAVMLLPPAEQVLALGDPAAEPTRTGRTPSARER
jgi:nucleotide-binding universal stress UspA family protein